MFKDIRRWVSTKPVNAIAVAVAFAVLAIVIELVAAWTGSSALQTAKVLSGFGASAIIVILLLHWANEQVRRKR